MIMKIKLHIYSFITSCLLLLSCNSKSEKDNFNKQVRQLNDSAVAIGSLGDTAKIMVAIELLNKVIAMKPDYYSAYWNKLAFQYRLGLLDDAFATLKSMEQINPESPELKTMIGAFLEQNKKASIQAMTKYKEADLLYKNILDTISPNCLSYQSTMINYILISNYWAKTLMQTVFYTHPLKTTIMARKRCMKHLSNSQKTIL